MSSDIWHKYSSPSLCEVVCNNESDIDATHQLGLVDNYANNILGLEAGTKIPRT